MKMEQFSLYNSLRINRGLITGEFFKILIVEGHLSPLLTSPLPRGPVILFLDPIHQLKMATFSKWNVHFLLDNKILANIIRKCGCKNSPRSHFSINPSTYNSSFYVNDYIDCDIFANGMTNGLSNCKGGDNELPRIICMKSCGDCGKNFFYIFMCLREFSKLQKPDRFSQISIVNCFCGQIWLKMKNPIQKAS
jgi:hypothetical protein